MTDITTTSTPRPGTGDEDDKLTDPDEQITGGVAALVDSDAWRAMLDTAARFHSHSLGDLLLIAAGTYRTQGRRVPHLAGLARQVRPRQCVRDATRTRHSTSRVQRAGHVWCLPER